jgi:hypothetical protein
VDGRIILKWILKKNCGRVGFDSYGSGKRQVAGRHKYCNESSVYAKCGDTVD